METARPVPDEVEAGLVADGERGSVELESGVGAGVDSGRWSAGGVERFGLSGRGAESIETEVEWVASGTQRKSPPGADSVTAAKLANCDQGSSSDSDGTGSSRPWVRSPS